MAAKTKQFHSTLPVTLAMTAPAVRMVIVHVWAQDGEDGTRVIRHEFIPVLAIVARERRHYLNSTRPEHDRPDAGGDHREMLSLGWDYDPDLSEGYEMDMIVYTEELGLVEVGFAMRGFGEQCPAVCPWPPEQDEERLAEHLAKLTENIRFDDSKRPRSSDYAPDLPT